MNTIKILFNVVFSPKRFFAERFLKVSSKQIFIVGFLGIMFGLMIGNIFNIFIPLIVKNDFLNNKEPYLAAIKSLGLSEQGFIDLLKTQRAYALLLIILSPVLAYVGPHLFGGALFLFLWLLVRPEKITLSLHHVMECSAISLASTAYYCLPVIGPITTLIMVGINVSRALTMRYHITGFMKAMSIVSAMYICFFLTNATLQLLAIPLARILK